MRIAVGVVSLVLFLVGCATQSPNSESYGSATGYNPRAAELNVQLGANYMAQGQLNLANTKLLRALEQDPRSASAHWTYALLNERLGEYQLAETHFKRALSINSKDSRAHNNYGTFLCNRGRLDEADEHFQKALANPLYQYPQSAYMNAGLCAMKVPDYDKASGYFTEVLTLNSRNRVALYQMAKIDYEQGIYAGAADYMNNFEKVSPHNAQTLWLAFKIHNALGETRKTQQYAEQLKTNFPSSEEARELARY